MHFARLSPCNGAANPDQAPAFDIAGNPRSDPSIGAFEYEAGGFTCSIVASGATASQPEKVTLGCGLDGDYAEPLAYAWDLVGDGSVLSQGATAELTAIGVYRPSVTVTDANGKKATTAYVGSIVIYGEGGAVYVTSKGHATAKPPYATWETAATNVADVIVYAQSGNEVLLDAGTHLLTGGIDITTPITIRGAEGPDVTFVGHTNTTSRLFYLRNSNAVLADFTVKDGDFRNTYHGAIVKLDPGKVVNCRFIGNLVSGHGGVETTGAGSCVERCVFRGNVTEDKAQGPTCVKVAADGTIVRNCLFVGNTNLHANATVYYSGAAINMANDKSSVLNCTFVDNFTSNAQHAAICNDTMNQVYCEATVRNCVSTGNRRVVDGVIVDGNDIGAVAAKQSDSIVWPTAFDYSSFTNVKTVDPLLDPVTLKPRAGSPCVNGGVLLDYTAESVDLKGNPRVYRFGARSARPDLGCYETTYGTPGLTVLVR